MRLAVAAFTVALGYALIYYAIGLFRNYFPNAAVQSNQKDPTAVEFWSIGQLLGVTKLSDNASAHVPFASASTASSSTTPASNTNPPTSQPKGGIQLA